MGRQDQGKIWYKRQGPESRTEVPGESMEGKMGASVSWVSSPIWDNEKVLEVASKDHCTTVNKLTMRMDYAKNG